MGVEDDDEEDDEAHNHIGDGEYAVNAGLRVEVGEVIDGCDESVPWEEVAQTQCEVDYVGQMERVVWDFIGCGAAVDGCGGEEETRFRIFFGGFDGETHRRLGQVSQWVSGFWVC